MQFFFILHHYATSTCFCKTAAACFVAASFTLDDTFGPETAVFSSIFNALGFLPAMMASLLCGGGAFAKGRQPVPPQPFVFGAFALGFFALGPYLALRNYLPEVDSEGDEVSTLEVCSYG